MLVDILLKERNREMGGRGGGDSRIYPVFSIKNHKVCVCVHMCLWHANHEVYEVLK